MSSMVLKVKRGYPVTGSMPTQARTRPISAPITPLRTLPEEREAMIVSANTHSQNCSGAPNFMDTLARGTDRNRSAETPKIPPNTDEMSAVKRAFCACPFMAIGYPSNVVQRAAAVPGVLMRMEGMDPPYSEPQYTEPSISSAVADSSPNVKGRSSAMPSVPDNPGTAPIMMPKQALRVMSSSVTGSDRLERTTHGSNMFISLVSLVKHQWREGFPPPSEPT